MEESVQLAIIPWEKIEVDFISAVTTDNILTNASESILDSKA